jgi:hypothetical protein
MAERSNVLADSDNILNGWENCFSPLSNIHEISDVRQMEIHTAGP